MLSFVIPIRRSLLLIVFVLVAVGCGREAPHPIATGMDHPARPLAAWIGRLILDKLVDDITVQSRKNEIQTDLVLFETSLERVDIQLSSRIRDVRTQLESKVSVEDIRRIIDETVTVLETHVEGTDEQLTTAETRVKELEAIIGYVPTVTPSPLLRINAQGKPEAHPLTVKWANLLASSHVHWIEMEKLNQIYKPNAPEMHAAMAKHHKFQQNAVALRQEVKQQLAVALVERMKLLETRRFNHPAVKDFDASIASLTWLAKIIQVEEGGPYQGMLVVPEQLVGPAASDIVAAFELAGAETKDLVPLYQKLLHLLPETDDVESLEPQDSEELRKQFVKLNGAAQSTHEAVVRLEGELLQIRSDHSDLHPKVVALNKRRVELLARIRKHHADANTLLIDALRNYVENMKIYRMDHAVQMRLAHRIVKPLAELSEKANCFDWENAEAGQATWNNFMQTGKYFGHAHVYNDQVTGRQRTTNVQDALQQCEREIAGRKQPGEDERQCEAFRSGTPYERSNAARYLKDNSLLTDELIAEAIPAVKLLLSGEERYCGVMIVSSLDCLHETMAMELANAVLAGIPAYSSSSDGKSAAYNYRSTYQPYRQQWRSLCEESLRILGGLGAHAKHVLPTLEAALAMPCNRTIAMRILRAIHLIGGLSKTHARFVCDVIEDPTTSVDEPLSWNWTTEGGLFTSRQYHSETNPYYYVVMQANVSDAYWLVREVNTLRPEFVRSLRKFLETYKSGSITSGGAGINWQIATNLFMVDALELLASLGAEAVDARPAIEPLLLHESPEIRKAAADAMRRIPATDRTP